VPTRAACQICSGALIIAQRGSGFGRDPAAFNPSRHRVGEHYDLYRCVDCGTVNQPGLPPGTELQDLYRVVHDERYLPEERGRRRTAGRLLDLLSAQVPHGHLLQVGCGYGLLLDEARRRGYEVDGVEVSVEAARHAQEVLGLPVREMAIEDVELVDGCYDGILLVDVIEHLDDPIGVLERLLAVLAPGGALLIVTPDPASFVARVAGRRWWCYVPAHRCLIPRRTLRRLLRERGLAVLVDTHSVHTFTLAYWLSGFGERGGWAGSAITRVAERLPRSLMFTASLKDERVLLARRADVHAHTSLRASIA
jgi:2-polyprenyl-3-methyl-5-hydroxy-6-metoxy-1,4-benzoquinol methylase